MKSASILIATLAVLSLPAFAQRAELVTSVQAELGVSPIDGKMGPRTHEAIGRFQRSKGLEASGQLDKETITALGLDGPKPSAAAGTSTRMQGKPSAPVGPQQSAAERTAEPKIKPAVPTGETK